MCPCLRVCSQVSDPLVLITLQVHIAIYVHTLALPILQRALARREAENARSEPAEGGSGLSEAERAGSNKSTLPTHFRSHLCPYHYLHAFLVYGARMAHFRTSTSRASLRSRCRTRVLCEGWRDLLQLARDSAEAAVPCVHG